MKIDRIDVELMDELRKNSKITIKELSKKFNIHPNTVLQRIRRLETTGIIKRYQAVIDYRKLGYSLTAIIVMDMSKEGMESIDNLLKGIQHLSELESLYITSGGVDAVAIVHAKNNSDLLEIIKKIYAQKEVSKTTTYIVLKQLKHSEEFTPFPKLNFVERKMIRKNKKV